MNREAFALGLAGLLAAAAFAPRDARALSDVLYSSGGEGVDDQYGFAVSPAGDVNKDGTPDYLVGAPFFDAGAGEEVLQNAGKAYVHSGFSGEIIREFEGEAVGSRLGTAVETLGDLNGDGAAEIAVGAPYFGTETEVQLGKVYVYSGLDGGLLFDATGENQGDRFGSSLAAPGDVSGDGVGDLLVGAPEFDGPAGLRAGRAYAISGANGSVLGTLDGDAAGDRFGSAVAGAGNVDGDAVGDLAVGAPERSGGVGSVYVFAGGTGALLRRLDGVNAGEHFGAAIAGGGDTDGDGRDDLIVGVPDQDYLCPGTSLSDPPLNFPDVGRIDWYSGAEIASGFPGIAPLQTKQGDTYVPCKLRAGYQARFGASVRIVADYDLDDKADVLVGSPGADSANGKVFLYSGATGAQILEFFGGDSARLGFGAAVAEIRDASGDGIPDVLVGAYQHLSGKNDSGRVYVFSGAQTNLISNTRRFKPDEFAYALAGTDDLDGDGRADYCGGVPLWDENFLVKPTENRGAVECFGGTPDELSGLAGTAISRFWPTKEDPRCVELPDLPEVQAGQVYGSAVAAIRAGPGGALTDLVIGAPRRKVCDDLNIVRSTAGQAFRVSALGVTGDVISPIVLQEYRGVEVGDAFGTSIANAGDVNGDGWEDVIVGAPAADSVAGTGVGRAYVFSGLYGAPGDAPVLLHEYEGENAGDAFGSAVAGVGDVDGDGRDDLAVGAPGVDGPAGTAAGRVYVFSGASAGTAPILAIDGAARGEAFGASLAGLGDWNGNGFDDFAAGSPVFDASGGRTNGGRVTVLDGAFGATLLVLEGEAKGDEFGTAIAPARDVDEDGLPELLVGAPFHPNLVGWKTGKAYIYSSRKNDEGVVAGALLLSYTGQANGDLFGASLAGGGDMDGDGVPDVAIGSSVQTGTPGASTGAYGRGYAYNVVCKDRDGDGYGSPPSPLCPQAALDCKDLDPEVNPGKEEIVGNGKDDDCDALTPEFCDAGTLFQVVLFGPQPPPAEQSVGSIVVCLRFRAGL